jgi:PAS domain S-box-containing protein
MSEPKKIYNEEERLKNLYSYRILDTDGESDFDFITAMAAQICGTKYATVTLVDKERQWFKSAYGLTVKETPISHSVCALAIQSPDDFYEVQDSATDPNMSSHPAWTELGIKYYASYPLISEDGYALGTLCVADDEQKTLSEEQKKTLRALSTQVMRLLELRKRNSELKRNQAYYKSLLENTHGSPYRCKNDPNQTFVFLTDGFEKITGFSLKDFLDNPNKSFINLIHKEDLEKVLSVKEKAIKEKKPWQLQYRIVHSSGLIKWIDERGKVFLDQVAQEYYLDGILLDISATKNEEVLFRNIFDNSQGLICIHDFNGKILKINEAASISLGYELDEVIGKNLRQFINEYDQFMIDLYFEEMKKVGRHKGILRLKSKNGINKYWAYDNSVADFGGISDIIVTNSVDITESIKIEKALKATEERLQMIAETIDDAYYVYDVSENKYEYFSPNSEKVIGVNIDFFHSGKSFTETFVHEEDRQICLEGTKKLHNGEAYNIEFRVIINNQVRWLNEKAFPVSNLQKKEKKVAGRVSDITARKEIQLELGKTKEILEQASKTASVGAWEVDLLDKKVNWSNVMKEIHGVDQGFELSVENSLQFFKKGFNRNKVREGFDQLIKKGKSIDQELIIIDSHGQEKWVRLIAKGEYKMGQCIRLYGTMQDINNIRKKTSELIKTKQQLESILSEMEDVVWAVKLPTKRALFVTPSIKDFFGIEPDEGMEDADFWLKFIHPEDIAVVKEIRKQIDDLKSFEKEFRIIKTDGSIRWVYTLGKIIFDDHDAPVRLDIKMTDITKDKQFESQLIAETERANAASKSKSEFLANMSHEIRTPLNGVIGFTDILLKTELSHIQKQYAENANTAGKSLLNLINDILDFSKIEAGKLDMELIETDLHQLLYETMDIIKYPAGQKNLEVILDINPNIPESVLLDPFRLRQILINLLNNAIKFTEKGHVILKVDFQTKENQEMNLAFSVIDTGIGISESQQKKLFKAFSQADNSTTRKFGGTGLGLTISNLLAEKMGGNIQIESKEGKGSTFFFHVNSKVLTPTNKPLEPSLPFNKVLVVDDNRNVAEVLAAQFSFWHVKTYLASNGLEAFKILKEHSDIEMALIDYHMPYVNGLDVTGKIRNDLGLGEEKLPVFLMSYYSDEKELADQLKPLGIKQTLIKPLKLKQVFSILQSYRETEKNTPVPSQPSKRTDSKIEGEFTILVAEDISMNMLLLKTLLNNILNKVKVIECSNGKIALEKYKENKVDLIFMDVQMPEMDGLTATQKIRNYEAENNIKTPIVALTAGALSEEREKCFKAGMDDFLTKPIQPNSLKAVLEKHLNCLENTAENLDALESKGKGLISFNKGKLLKLIDNNIPLLKELLITSKDLSSKVYENIDHLKQSRLDEIQANAHYIRGASQSMGFDILAEITGDLEMRAKEADLESLNALVAEVKEEWDKLAIIIENEISIINT